MPSGDSVVVDMTALDTAHRTRGIGRYAQGLMDGFCQLTPEQNPLRLEWLRAPRQDSPPTTIGEPYGWRHYPRRLYRGAFSMALENLFRLDPVLTGAALYHGLGMEAMAWRTPSVVTCHDLIPLLLPELYLKKVSQKLFWNTYPLWLKARPKRIIAISNHVKSTLCARGIEPERIDVVYHGLSSFWHPVPRAQERDQKLGLPQGRFLLFVGGFDPRKNFELILQALQKITPSKRPLLVVAGNRTPEILAEHGALVPKYGVEASVKFLGYIDDEELRYLYSQCRALLFPSLEEGWGFPIVEAMACGAPVLCANFGSMMESSGGAGLDLDVRDDTAVGEAMDRLWQDDELCAKLKEDGLERVKVLNWAECAKHTLAVYDKVLSGG